MSKNSNTFAAALIECICASFKRRIVCRRLTVFMFHGEREMMADSCSAADLQSRGSGQGTTAGYGSRFSSQSRPNAHGGAHNLHSVGVGSSQTTLQPRTNTHQKFSGRTNAAPLPVCDSVATTFPNIRLE